MKALHTFPQVAFSLNYTPFTLSMLVQWEVIMINIHWESNIWQVSFNHFPEIILFNIYSSPVM